MSACNLWFQPSVLNPPPSAVASHSHMRLNLPRYFVLFFHRRTLHSLWDFLMPLHCLPSFLPVVLPCKATQTPARVSARKAHAHKSIFPAGSFVTDRELRKCVMENKWVVKWERGTSKRGSPWWSQLLENNSKRAWKEDKVKMITLLLVIWGQSSWKCGKPERLGPPLNAESLQVCLCKNNVLLKLG